MATPEVLDFAKLTAPIPGEKPTGADLRADPSSVSDFYKIRDARKKASDTERKLDQGDVEAAPDWRPVLDGGTKALAEKTKDLEIAAYLIEALVRLRGFAGLRDGFRMAGAMVERFWDGLYPAPEEGVEVEERFSHVLWLSGIDKPGTLIVPVRKIPLSDSANQGRLTYAQYLQAKALDELDDSKVKQKRIAEGALTLETVRAAVAETPAKFYADLVEDIDQALDQFARFGEVLKSQTSYDVPSSDLKDVLESFQHDVKNLAADKLQSIQAAATAAQAAGAAAGASAAGPAAGDKPADPSIIKDRTDAMDRLLKIAGYFRAHEPHSIIPYALEQIVNWGKMSLPELLAELIPEEGPRKNLFKQVGIKPPEAKK